MPFSNWGAGYVQGNPFRDGRDHWAFLSRDCSGQRRRWRRSKRLLSCFDCFLVRRSTAGKTSSQQHNENETRYFEKLHFKYALNGRSYFSRLSVTDEWNVERGRAVLGD